MDGYGDIGPEIPTTSPEIPDLSLPTETPAERIEDYNDQVEIELERGTEVDDTQETDQDSGRPRRFEIYSLFSQVIAPENADEQPEEEEDDTPSFWDIVAGKEEDDTPEEDAKESKSPETPHSEALVENAGNDAEEDSKANETKNFVEKVESQPEAVDTLETEEADEQKSNPVIKEVVHTIAAEPVKEETAGDKEEPVEPPQELTEPIESTETHAEAKEELVAVEEPVETGTDGAELPSTEEIEEPGSAPEVAVTIEQELAPPETTEIVDAVIVDENDDAQEADEPKADQNTESQEAEENNEPEAVEPVEVNDNQETATEAEDITPKVEPIQTDTPPAPSPEPIPEARENPEPTWEPAEAPEPEAVDNNEPLETPQNPEIPVIPEVYEIPSIAELLPSTESAAGGFLSGVGRASEAVGGGIASIFLAPTQRYETVGVSVAKTSIFEKKPTHFNVTVRRAGTSRTTTITVRASDAKVAERRAKSLRSLTPWNRFRIAFRTN